MKKISMSLKIILVLALILVLAGCGKPNANGNGKSNGKEPVKAVEQVAVPGATLGSAKSNYVADREVWRNIPSVKDKSVEEVDLHVPKFLLDSADAKKVNEELDGIVEIMLKNAKDIEQDMPGSEVDMFMNASFSIYQDDKVLSVYFTSNYYMEYSGMAFNFRLSDGKLLQDKELAAIYGIESTYLGLMEKSIAKDYKEEEAWSNAYDQNFSEYSMCFQEGLALQDLWSNITPDSRLYLDESGQIRFLFTKYIAEGSGSVLHTLPLEQTVPMVDKELNPIYVRMARVLGRDPVTDNSPAYIMHLGGMYDDYSVAGALDRLYPWMGDFNEYQLINYLPRLDPDSIDYPPDLAGEETYVIVPKWEHSTVSLVSLEPTPAGTLAKVDNMYNDNMSVRGTTLVCINKSDIFQNSEIVIRYRGEQFSFVPYISMMDGSVVLPREIVDATELLPPLKIITEENRSQTSFSYAMYDRVMAFMPRG